MPGFAKDYMSMPTVEGNHQLARVGGMSSPAMSKGPGASQLSKPLAGANPLPKADVAGVQMNTMRHQMNPLVRPGGMLTLGKLSSLTAPMPLPGGSGAGATVGPGAGMAPALPASPPVGPPGLPPMQVIYDEGEGPVTSRVPERSPIKSSPTTPAPLSPEDQTLHGGMLNKGANCGVKAKHKTKNTNRYNVTSYKSRSTSVSKKAQNSPQRVVRNQFSAPTRISKYASVRAHFDNNMRKHAEGEDQSSLFANLGTLGGMAGGGVAGDRIGKRVGLKDLMRNRHTNRGGTFMSTLNSIVSGKPVVNGIGPYAPAYDAGNLPNAAKNLPFAEKIKSDPMASFKGVAKGISKNYRKIKGQGSSYRRIAGTADKVRRAASKSHVTGNRINYGMLGALLGSLLGNRGGNALDGYLAKNSSFPLTGNSMPLAISTSYTKSVAGSNPNPTQSPQSKAAADGDARQSILPSMLTRGLSEGVIGGLTAGLTGLWLGRHLLGKRFGRELGSDMAIHGTLTGGTFGAVHGASTALRNRHLESSPKKS